MPDTLSLELQHSPGDLVHLFDDVYAHADDVFCVRGGVAAFIVAEARKRDVWLRETLKATPPEVRRTGLQRYNVQLHVDARTMGRLFDASVDLSHGHEFELLREDFRRAIHEGAHGAVISMLGAPNDFPTLERVRAADAIEAEG
jgi:hypothetical protein